MSQPHSRPLPSAPRLARALRFSLVVLAALASGVGTPSPTRAASPPVPDAVHEDGALLEDVTQGALRVKRPGGEIVECPLRHTDVRIDVSGFVARARVTQTFDNPWDEAIEAVYVFPLPHAAAVDEMTLVVGERRIVGRIERRAEARRIYTAALAAGHTAALLEQERPNIFTQSVGNIPPRSRVRVEIGYVDVLGYDAGAYELHFPMVVGPRYIPGTPASRTPAVTPENAGKVGRAASAPAGAGAADPRGTGWSPDTDRVPDASRITPPVLKPGYRTGHDVSLAVRLDAGVPMRDLRVASHRVDVAREGRSRARVALAAGDSLPNKDFVLTYKVAGERPELALLAHAPGDDDGSFLLMMQPRDLGDALGEAPPRDVCFLIDVSGSMSGQPTAKVVETMRQFFGRLRPRDRVQVVTFAGGTQTLFPSYRDATPETLRDALSFTDSLRGGGGTEMLRGIQAVLAQPLDPLRVRVVVMLTDGYIGNEAEIIRAVGRHSGDQLRFWSIGIGSSPNRYLLDGVARQGGGMSGVLGLHDDPGDLVARMSDRLQRAQLSKVEVDWGGLDVYETYPAQAPELWSGRPLVLFGRYRAGGEGVVRLSGSAEGQPMAFDLPVSLPAREPAHAALTSVWARHKIEDLSDQLALTGAGQLEEDITEIALRHRLMSAYTSFVAVDEDEIAPEAVGRPPRRVTVPLPLPEGVAYEGVFGAEVLGDADEGDAFLAMGGASGAPAEANGKGERRVRQAAAKTVRRSAYRGNAPAAAPPSTSPASVAGVPGGVAGGVAGGVLGGMVAATPPAPPPANVVALAAQVATLEEETREAYADRAGRAGPASAARLHRAAQEAQAGLARARAHLAEHQIDAARFELRLAYLKAEAGRSLGFRAGPEGVEPILNEWSAAEQALRARAVAALPALGRRLDLVLRHTDAEQALGTLAGAAGVKLRTAPGSFDDVRALRARTDLRVSFLDLRGATAAEGFDALVGMLGLDWRVETDTVTVTSVRRRPGVSAWAYLIADLARPTRDELRHDPTAADGDQALDALDELLRAALPPAADVALLTPERLVVAGDQEAHARARALLDTLRGTSGPDAVSGLSPTARAALEALRPKTLARAAAHADALTQRARLVARVEAAQRLQRGAWMLLADVAGGGPGLEGAAEIAEACHAGVAHDATALARAAWALREARAAGHVDTTLALAERLCAHADRHDVPAAPTAALYASLAQGQAQPEPRLPDATDANLQAVARLLASGAQADAEPVLAALEDGRLRGDDAVVAAAVALHRAGGAARARLRAGRMTWLAPAALSGDALRLLNRLEGARLAALAARPDAGRDVTSPRS